MKLLSGSAILGGLVVIVATGSRGPLAALAQWRAPARHLAQPAPRGAMALLHPGRRVDHRDGFGRRGRRPRPVRHEGLVGDPL